MELFNFPGTPLTHDEVLRQLTENGRNERRRLTKPFSTSSRPYRPNEMENNGAPARRETRCFRKEWTHCKTAPAIAGASGSGRKQPAMGTAIQSHSARPRTRLVPVRGGRPSRHCPNLPAISVLNPEVCDIDSADTGERNSYQSTVEHHLHQLGLDEVVLLRGLDICEFSFGYTRVSSILYQNQGTRDASEA